MHEEESAICAIILAPATLSELLYYDVQVKGPREKNRRARSTYG